MRIYTRTGDGGETGLIGGARVRKDDLVIEAFGQLDELNSALGATWPVSGDWPEQTLVQRVQSLVFDVGAEIAAPVDSKWHQEAPLGTISAELEASIDAADAVLPPLKNFILPGGCELSVRLHHARVVCRRAERTLVTLAEEVGVRADVLAFLNRLSDWLFTMARAANHRAGVSDVVWIRGS